MFCGSIERSNVYGSITNLGIKMRAIGKEFVYEPLISEGYVYPDYGGHVKVKDLIYQDSHVGRGYAYAFGPVPNGFKAGSAEIEFLTGVTMLWRSVKPYWQRKDS